MSTGLNRTFEKNEVRITISLQTQQTMSATTDIALLLAFAYPGINAFYWYPKIQPEVEAEIQHDPTEYHHVEVFRYKTDYSPPIIIHTGNIGIPVGGGTYTNTERIYTVSHSKKQIYEQYSQIPTDDNYTHKQHVNTHHDLENCVRNHRIPTTQFPITLPLLVRHYKFPNGIYMHKCGVLGASKHHVLRAALTSRKLPFSTAAGMIAGGCLAACWAYYALHTPMRYEAPYYPPLHHKRYTNGYRLTP